MGRDVRFIVMSRDESFGLELRALLGKIGGAKVVAEVDEPALLGQAVKQFPVDVVWVDLDPVPEAILPLLGEVAAASPGLAFFATSESTDGKLILNAMRTGVREFFPKPIDRKNVEQAFGKVAAQLSDAVAVGKLISVMGASGGVGVTMIASNLAVELALLTQGNVVVVDLDYRFGQVATLLDVEPTYTLADLCATPEQLEPAVITRALVKHDTGVRVLSRPASFAQAETITAASCVGLLNTLLQLHDYVVTDGPNRSDPATQAVLNLADSTMLTLQLLVPHVRNSVRLLDALRESGQNVNHVKLLCNRVGREAGHLSVDDVASTLSLPTFASIPDDWQTVSGAINLGEPLATYSPKSKTRLAIQEIARRLHSQESDADDKEQRKKGFIGRIFAGSA